MAFAMSLGTSLCMLGYGVRVRTARRPNHSAVRTLGCSVNFTASAVRFRWKFSKSWRQCMLSHSRKCPLSSDSRWHEGHSCDPGCG